MKQAETRNFNDISYTDAIVYTIDVIVDISKASDISLLKSYKLQKLLV